MGIVRSFLLLLLLFFILLSDSFGQGSAGEKARYESLYIVNMPTAGIVPKYAFSLNGNIFENSGMSAEFSASPFSDFNIGVSYGGSNIIGTAEPGWQNLPGILVRIRLFDESLKFPAIIIGFNSQGRGNYFPGLKRFQNMSPGFFISASKSYSWKLGFLGVHGGINYSLEPSSADRSPNYYGGIEQSFGNRGSINFEYNATLDEKPGLIINKRGLLNLAIRYSVTQNMTLELQFIDLLNHQNADKGAIRRLGIEYTDSF